MKITARKLPHITEIHGQKLTDNYHWLRDQNWPKVENEEILTFLKSENLYTEEFFKPLQVQIDNLYKQMLGRIKLVVNKTHLNHIGLIGFKRNYGRNVNFRRTAFPAALFLILNAQSHS